MRFSSIAIILIFITACSTSSNQKDEQRIAKKVDAILNQMTLAEKVGQMTQVDLRMFDEYDDIKKLPYRFCFEWWRWFPKKQHPE